MLFQFFLVVDRREAGDHGARREIFGDAGLSHDDGILADGNVAVEAGHAADRDVVFESDRTGKADQRGDGAAPADIAVVGDVGQAVDLGPRADPRRAKRPAGDAGVGIDLDIILNDDRADLGDLFIFIIVPDKAVTVDADPAAGVEDNAPADLNAVVNGGRSVDHAVIADLDVFTDIDERIDGDPLAEPGARGNDRGLMDAGLDL